MQKRRLRLRIVIFLLFIFMAAFGSCEKANICWTCVNPLDSTDRFDVCNTMSKLKWESYGYNCY
jgi:hypothetical protein